MAASATEKIIVRASNPGQFDQDDIQWQRGQASDAIYHNVSTVFIFSLGQAFLQVESNSCYCNDTAQSIHVRLGISR